jgi:hypothetical protein
MRTHAQALKAVDRAAELEAESLALLRCCEYLLGCECCECCECCEYCIWHARRATQPQG